MSETTGLPTYPCCEHCVPEANGRCWAHDCGHGCSCLKCPPPDAAHAAPDEEQSA